MEDVSAKGVNFLYSKRFVESQYGGEVWARVMKSLSEESREIWSAGILAHREYPFAAFKEMISALARETKSTKDPEIARIYEHIADQSLSKIFKIFFALSKPSFVIKNYPKLWDKFFNAGKVEVPVSGEGHAVVKFILPEIFLDWLPAACLGYSKKAVEMAGGKNLTMKTLTRVPVSEGTWEITYELRWQD